MPTYPVFDHARFPLMTSLLGDAGFKLVDIGGRGSAFPPLVSLAPFAHYYAAEPDVEEAERLTQELPRRGAWRGVTVMTEAIASNGGEADLYLTSSAGMSSLLRPDPAVARRYYIAGKFEVVKVVNVPTLPLDDAASTYGFADAAFLKLDTQGSELDILQSGASLVAGPLLGIHTEASFHAFYQGQPLFADVDAHLRRNGFELFALNRTLLRRSGYKPSLYSTRVVVWAHCLYLREPELLLTNDRDVLRLQLSRLLGLALAFEFCDLAFEIVKVARRGAALESADLERLREEVGTISRVGTRHMMRRAEKHTSPDDVLSASFHDKNQVE